MYIFHMLYAFWSEQEKTYRTGGNKQAGKAVSQLVTDESDEEH